jgi:pyruvate ferredoxin oxidoreductase delta subunit
MLENGWNTFEIGTILRPFEGSASDIAHILPEDRTYSKSNSFSVSVADWRIEKPLLNLDECIHCQFCWIYCPDMSIISRDKKMVSIDFDHCKGCGICVEVCPTNALLMFPEQQDEAAALANWPEPKNNEVKEN